MKLTREDEGCACAIRNGKEHDERRFAQQVARDAEGYGWLEAGVGVGALVGAVGDGGAGTGGGSEVSDDGGTSDGGWAARVWGVALCADKSPD